MSKRENETKEKTYQRVYSEQDKYAFKRSLNNDSDEACLTSFVMEFQTEREAKVLRCCVQDYQEEAWCELE